MTMNVQNQLRLLMLSVLAFFAICTAANAVDPECLPANICGYRYYVIQEDGDLVNWGDYGCLWKWDVPLGYWTGRAFG